MKLQKCGYYQLKVRVCVEIEDLKCLQVEPTLSAMEQQAAGRSDHSEPFIFKFEVNRIRKLLTAYGFCLLQITRPSLFCSKPLEKCLSGQWQEKASWVDFGV